MDDMLHLPLSSHKLANINNTRLHLCVTTLAEITTMPEHTYAQNYYNHPTQYTLTMLHTTVPYIAPYSDQTAPYQEPRIGNCGHEPHTGYKPQTNASNYTQPSVHGPHHMNRTSPGHGESI